MQRFKTMAMKRYADGVTRLGWPPFRGRLWQRGYYERVIRDDDELNRIRRYIVENPAHWPTDVENPTVVCARARVNAPAWQTGVLG
jgi:REP element-mobilizing transposase RayT